MRFCSRWRMGIGDYPILLKSKDGLDSIHCYTLFG